jgi:hypothetical protein
MAFVAAMYQGPQVFQVHNTSIASWKLKLIKSCMRVWHRRIIV